MKSRQFTVLLFNFFSKNKTILYNKLTVNYNKLPLCLYLIQENLPLSEFTTLQRDRIQRLWADYLNKDFVKLQMSIILYYNYYIPKWMWVSRANLYKLEIWRPGTWQVFFNTTSLLYKLYKSNISWTQYDLQINSSYFFINLFLSKKKKQLNQSKTFFGHSCIKDISQDINLHGVN